MPRRRLSGETTSVVRLRERGRGCFAARSIVSNPNCVLAVASFAPAYREVRSRDLLKVIDEAADLARTLKQVDHVEPEDPAMLRVGRDVVNYSRRARSY